MAAGARYLQCRQHAEQERTGTTEERRARQHDDVETDLVEARCIRGRDADETSENRGAGKGTEHATGPNQQRVFDEQLTDQAPAAAADRRANAELLRARRAPVQQQAGQVDAGDEQQQRDGAGEHGQRWRHIPHHAVGERDDVDAGAPLVDLRVFQRKGSRDVLHFRPRRGHVYSALEPADGIETRVAAAALHPAVVGRHLRLEQQIHVGRRHVTKAWRQDADHRIWTAEGERLADRGRRAAELAHRERVADDGRRRGVGPGVRWVEEPAPKRRRAEHAKEVDGDASRVEPPRQLAARDDHRVGQ